MSYFSGPPATTIIPASSPGFIIPDSRVEINVIALADRGARRKEIVAGSEDPLFAGWVSAVRAGDLLLLSGLMGLEGGKLAAGAIPNQEFPFYGIPMKSELHAIISQAEAICKSAGTSLRNVVRIQQFHRDLVDLPVALEQWSYALDGAPLPLSAIEVPWLPVPQARVLVDLWVYAPRRDADVMAR